MIMLCVKKAIYSQINPKSSDIKNKNQQPHTRNMYICCSFTWQVEAFIDAACIGGK